MMNHKRLLGGLFLLIKSDYDEQIDNREYDLAIIGGGSGGIQCALEASKKGMNVIIFDYVEKSVQNSEWGLGGTCLNVGCIPKKLMHQSALYLHSLHKMHNYGIDLTFNQQVAWQTLTTNIQNYIKQQNFNYKVQLQQANITYVNQLASLNSIHDQKISIIYSSNKQALIDFNNNQINSAKKYGEIKAKYVVIATGGRPNYLSEDICKNSKKYCISSDDLFSLKNSPGKTLVVGGGYIAIECAGLLQGLGFEVDLMTRGDFLRSFDRQIVEYILEDLRGIGVKVMGKNLPFEIEKNNYNERLLVKYRDSEGQVKESEYDTVMMAVGRVANSKGIGLERVGVEVDKDGKIKGMFNEELEQTNVVNIYSLGDVNQFSPELQPIAKRSGYLLAQRLALMHYNNYNSQQNSHLYFDYSHYPTTIFCPTEYSVVGLSEEQAIKNYGKDQIEVYHLRQNSLEDSIGDINATMSYFKVIVNKANQEEVVGIHYMGPNAGEIMQGFAVAFRKKLFKADLDHTVAIHPTLAETFVSLKISKGSGEEFVKESC